MIHLGFSGVVGKGKIGYFSADLNRRFFGCRTAEQTEHEQN